MPKLYTLKQESTLVGQHDGKLDARMTLEWFDLDYEAVVSMEAALLPATVNALVGLGKARVEADR